MPNMDELKGSTRALLPKQGIDADLCCKWSGQIILLTHVFQNGYVMGFWSHSPWGRCVDGEQGWVVLDENLRAHDYCETRCGGAPAGNDFRAWRRAIKDELGSAIKLCPDGINEAFWRMSND